MNYKERFYPEARFGGFTDIDITMAFYTRVNSLISSSSVILDIGCGRGACVEDPVLLRKNLRILKDKAARIIGIDADKAAMGNPFIDEFHFVQGYSWPIESGSIDLIVCDNVLEHIENPGAFFLEICRVLKRQGYLCIRTPNQLGYVALFSMLVPDKYHQMVISFLQKGRKEEDCFPTLYKCNTIWKLRRVMKQNGFECVVYGYEDEPAYLNFSKFGYFCGVLHQRFAPRFLKSVILAFGQINKK